MQAGAGDRAYNAATIELTRSRRDQRANQRRLEIAKANF